MLVSGASCNARVSADSGYVCTSSEISFLVSVHVCGRHTCATRVLRPGYDINSLILLISLNLLNPLNSRSSPHTPRKIRFVSVVWPSTIRFVRHSTRSSFDARYVKGVMSATQIWLRTSKVQLLYLRLTRPLYHVDRSHPHKVRLYVAIAKGM